jgi:hypothetical protein
VGKGAASGKIDDWTIGEGRQRGRKRSGMSSERGQRRSGEEKADVLER